MPVRGRCLSCGSNKVVIVGEDSYLKTRPKAAEFLDMSINTFRRHVEPELDPPRQWCWRYPFQSLKSDRMVRTA